MITPRTKVQPSHTVGSGGRSKAISRLVCLNLTVKVVQRQKPLLVASEDRMSYLIKCFPIVRVPYLCIVSFKMTLHGDMHVRDLRGDF